MKKINILGISGSLRSDSANTVILKAFRSLLPEGANLIIFAGMDEMPHFSPGLAENPGVQKFKEAIREADAVIICTPEYAFGIPGTLKNALDWTVATGEFNEKPVCAISGSPLNSGGEHALHSLLLTLTALGTKRNQFSFASIANIKSKITGQELSDTETIQLLRDQLTNLIALTEN